MSMEQSQENDNPTHVDKETKEFYTARENLVQDLLLGAATASAMGICFGYLMTKGNVYDGAVLIDQFKWTRVTMLKMFCAAGATSTACIGAISVYRPKVWKHTREKNRNPHSWFKAIVGGSLLGIGQVMSRCCPGPLMMSIGIRTRNSKYALYGALTGGFIYGLLHPVIGPFVDNVGPKYTSFFDELTGISYQKLAIIGSSMMLSAALMLEKYFPFKNEFDLSHNQNKSIMNKPYWNTLLCGAGIGLLQIPSVLILGNTIGSASSFVCITGQWLRLFSKETQNKFQHFRSQLNRFWQPLYIGMAGVGAYLAMKQNGDCVSCQFGSFKASSKKESFIGAALMMFGARLAGGCDSGHLSGFGFGTVSSWLTIGAIFASSTVWLKYRPATIA